MRYARILEQVACSPWAIEPTKGRVIADFLTRKAAGERIPEADRIAAAAGNRAPKPARPAKTVAVVPIYGTITQRAGLLTDYSGGTSTDEVGAMLDACLADPRIDVILLDVDSPGGSVFGVQELGAKIRAARSQKKVVGIANSMAASAGYWLLSQASEVVMTPGGLVGSIGVFQMHVDYSAALEQAGQAVTLISAGEMKTAGNSYEPLSEAARKSIQGQVDAYYEMFVKAVAGARGVAPADVRNGFGKGDVVVAQDALRLGMVDRIATFDETLARFGVGPAASSSGTSATRTGPRGEDPEIARRRRQLERDQAELDASKAELKRLEGTRFRQLSASGSFRDETAARRRILEQSLAEQDQYRSERVQRANISVRTIEGPESLPSTTPRVDPKLLRIAWHESGHAVAAVLLGAPVSSASIIPQPGSLGRVVHDGTSDPIAMATISFAGCIAERQAPFNDTPERWSDPSGGDWRNANAACPNPIDRRIAWDRATDLMLANAAAIRRVAAALLVSRTLDGPEVTRLVRNS